MQAVVPISRIHMHCLAQHGVIACALLGDEVERMWCSGHMLGAMPPHMALLLKGQGIALKMQVCLTRHDYV